MNRIHTFATLFAAAIVAACSSSAPEPAGPCAPRSGSYLNTLDARSGDCGQHSEALVVLDSASSSTPPGCRGGATSSADACRVTVDLLGCPDEADGRGYTGDYKGTVTWSHDGTSATGVVDLTVYNASGQIVCHGTYDSHYAKQ